MTTYENTITGSLFTVGLPDNKETHLDDPKEEDEPFEKMIQNLDQQFMLFFGK